MTELKIEIEGLDALKTALKKAPALVVSELETAVDSSAIVLKQRAIHEAPVNKGPGGGNLRQRILTNKTSRLSSEIIPSVQYALYVHEGTRPHEIRPSVKKALANVRAGQFFGKVVNHPGSRANPFLRRAFLQTQSQITSFFRVAIDNVFKHIKKDVL